VNIAKEPPVSEFHWFCFPAHPQDLEKMGCRDLHKMRDGAAFANLQALLTSLGLRYADPLFNVGPKYFQEPATPVRPGGLLVMSTRPPMDDDPKERKTIPTTKTRLEKQVFASVRQAIQISSRQGIRLSDPMRDRLQNARWTRFHPDERTEELPVRPNRHVSRFKLYGPGKFIPSERGEGNSLGYLALIPPRQGPDGLPQRVLAAWGMSGYATLFWTWLLRKRLQKQVAGILSSSSPRMLIGEFQIPAEVADYTRTGVDAVVL
jgi:hypothetical protein